MEPTFKGEPDDADYFRRWGQNLTITSIERARFTVDPDAATTLRVDGTHLAPGEPAALVEVTKSITITLDIAVIPTS